MEQKCSNLREISGNIAMPGFTAPKLLWIKNNEPEIFKKIDKEFTSKRLFKITSLRGICY